MKRAGLLFFLVLLGGSVFGYEFRLSPIITIGPLAAQQQRLDDNGTACGLLYVETNISDLDVQLSMLGGCGVEKVPGGYNIYLAYGTNTLSLAAPQFKPLHWEFGEIQALQYKVRVAPAGSDPKSFSSATHALQGRFWFSELGVYSRYMNEEAATLIVNTDLPFEVLEKEVLAPQSYSVYSSVEKAPYYLKIKPGTELKDISCPASLQGELPWNEKLERLNDYVLDLSWEPNPSDVKQKMQDIKNQLKQEIKTTLNRPL